MEIRGSRLVQGWTAVAAVAAAAVVLVSCSGSAETGLCRPNLDPHLTPPGNGPDAYTMGIRVNQASDVDEIESSFGDRILPRDVFVINTEFPSSKPSDWEGALERVSEKFRCNRIVTLTGLSPDPQKPGYEYALVGHRELDAVLIDWEPDTWDDANQGHWTPGEAANLGRIDSQLRALAQKLATTDHTRMALVPDYMTAWDYGRSARVVAGANLLLDPIHRGYQIVQTQPNCGTPSAPGPLIGGVTGQLRGQYKDHFGAPLPGGTGANAVFDSDLLDHLGFEVAFSETPNPKATEAVERLGPAEGARCTQQILKAGGAGVLYWASPEAIKKMLDTTTGQSLRASHSS
jgi:hypothetical protein